MAKCAIPNCENEVIWSGHGQRKKYCSEACKQKAKRWRERATDEELEALQDTKDEYAIYLLCDPRDGQVYYVGMTSDIFQRWHAHMQGEGNNGCKNQWIRGLRQQGLYPHFTVIEVVVGVKKAKRRESYWIAHYSKTSPVLTNINENKSRMARGA